MVESSPPVKRMAGRLAEQDRFKMLLKRRLNAVECMVLITERIITSDGYGRGIRL